MKLSYSDVRRFDDKLDRIISQNETLLSNQEVLIQLGKATVHQGKVIMATLADLKQNMDDLEVIAQQYLDFIIQKDALIAEKDAKIADLVSQLAAGTITIADLQAGIDQAVLLSQATEDKLRAGLPGVPPVGGTPLNVSYPDQASFAAAVAAYTGPEAVTLDGSEVRPGTAPSLDYFSHSADGSVSTSGPTD